MIVIASFHISPCVPTLMLDDFLCIECNNDSTLAHEVAPIAFSHIFRDFHIFLVKHACTTRDKPSSSAGFGPISSAGTGATNKALQLTYSSSACCPMLLLYMNSCSAL